MSIVCAEASVESVDLWINKVFARSPVQGVLVTARLSTVIHFLGGENRFCKWLVFRELCLLGFLLLVIVGWI